MMDNIQKMIVGVLGISGLLAMLTPSTVPFADKSNAVSPAVEAPVLAQNTESDAQFDEFEEEELTDEDDDFAIGEPAIDGNPIGVSSKPNEAPPPDYGQVTDYSMGNFAPQALTPQQAGPLPSPPGIQMPSDYVQ